IRSRHGRSSLLDRLLPRLRRLLHGALDRFFERDRLVRRRTAEEADRDSGEQHEETEDPLAHSPSPFDDSVRTAGASELALEGPERVRRPLPACAASAVAGGGAPPSR